MATHSKTQRKCKSPASERRGSTLVWSQRARSAAQAGQHGVHIMAWEGSLESHSRESERQLRCVRGIGESREPTTRTRSSSR